MLRPIANERQTAQILCGAMCFKLASVSDYLDTQHIFFMLQL